MSRTNQLHPVVDLLAEGEDQAGHLDPALGRRAAGPASTSSTT